MTDQNAHTNSHPSAADVEGVTNSVPSKRYLAHLTDDQIRYGIEEQRERLIRGIATLPGTDVDGATSVAECLKMADADFEVIKRPVICVIDEDTAAEMPGVFATLRADRMEVLGKRWVGKGYEIVQTAEAFATADVLMQRGDFSPTKVSVNGARVSLHGVIGASAIERIDCDTPDVIAHFATFRTAHDGTLGIEASFGSLRLECFNGMTSRQMFGAVKVYHTKNAADRMAEATATLLKLNDAAARETKMFQQLARERMSRPAFADFATELLKSIRGEADSERKLAKRNAELDELEYLFMDGQGNNGSTLWDGYNSVTEWLDHKLDRAGVSDTQRRLKAFESNDHGHGNKVKSRALRMLTR